MATPFATASDLATRLKVPVWDPPELNQVDQHLEDASNDLRAEIGWQVYPPTPVTVEAWPDNSGLVALPGSPITGITSVTQDGTALAADRYEWFGGSLRVYAAAATVVTYTVGYTQPPPELVKWTCVLAAQSLARAADGDFGGSPASRALADFRISYSEQQQLGELPIPPRVLERLRSTYGRAVYTT